MKYIVKVVTRFPFVTVILMTAITLYLGSFLKDLHMDNDIASMIPDDHPTNIAQNKIEEDFGVAEMVMVGLVTDNIYNIEFLQKIKNISKKLKRLKIESDPFTDPETGERKTRMKRCIEDVISLHTMPYIEGTEDGMEVGDLMKKVPRNDKETALLKERIASWDIYEGILVSADATATLIGIEYKSSLSYDEMMRMADRVRQAVEEIDFGNNVDVYIAGEPFVASVISKQMVEDNQRMLPAVFAVVVIFLLFVMRRFSSVILIFITIGMSVVWTMGFIGRLGYPIALMSSSIPILLVAIGSAVCIHIVSHYNDERAEGRDAATAVGNTIHIIGVSILATSVTTMVGFLSLVASGLVPIKEFGLFTAVGIGVAFIVSVFFVPSILIILNKFSGKKAAKNDKNRKSGKANIDLVPLLNKLFELTSRYSKPVTVAIVLVIVAAAYFSTKIYSDMNPVMNFKEKAEIRKAEAMLNEKFCGTTTMVVTVEADEDDFFKHPDALKKIDQFKMFMKNDPAVGEVSTLADSIKRMNYAMNSNQKEYDKIPDSKELIAQYLLLYGDPEDLLGMATADFRKVRMLVLLKDGSVNTLKRINTMATGWLSKEFPGFQILKGGLSQMALTTNDLVVTGQIKSLGFSIVIVFIIAAIIFRSIMGGLFTIIPLSISVIINFGILGLFRIPLDVGTSLIASIAIGIGVDYAIHFINGVKYGIIEGGLDNACPGGIKITGNAIVFNAFSVALGFLVLIFSSFLPLIKLGIFIALTMVTSAAGTLIILPVLINTIKPAFLRKYDVAEKL